MRDEYQDLLAYLVSEFEQQLQEFNPGLPEIVQRELDKTSSFVKFATEFLQRVRPQGTFAADANVGLVLENGARVLVCKPDTAPFSSSDVNNIDTSGAIPVRRR